MGRRLNTSTPTVIQTELVPLDDSFYIERMGEEQQWYYDNTRQYKPNRLLIPLELIPHLTAVDKDTKQEYSTDGGTLTLGSVTWTVRAYNEQQGKYVDTTVSSVTPSDEYYLVGNNLMVRKNVSYSHAVTIFCSASYNDPRDTGVAYVVNDQVLLLTSRDANIEYPNLDIMCPSSQSFNPLLDESSEFTMKAKADFDAVTSQSGKPYRADPLGTEEIVPQNDTDGVVTVAPIVDIRYGDVEQYDQTFMRRQTGGGVLSAIDGNKAYLQKVKGNSVAWNQICNYTQPVSLNKTSMRIFLISDIAVLPLHVYYGVFNISDTVSSSGDLIGCKVGNLNSNTNFTLSDGRKTLIQTTDSDARPQIYFYINNGSSSTAACTITNVQLIDLTLMFGAGNEPTTKEAFEAWLAANIGQLDYYPYNAGELVNVKMTGIKTVGFNQWDEEWENGIWKSDGTKDQTDTRAIRSKNIIPCSPSTNYYCCCGSEFIRGLVGRFLNIEGTVISSGNISNTIFSTPSGCVGIVICSYLEDEITAYNNDICINISDATKNGTYEAYWSKTAPFDPRKVYGKLNGAGSMVQVFPDGMRMADSAGTIRDILNIGASEADVNVNSINLGSLSWSKNTNFDTVRFISSNIDDGAKGSSNAVIYNAICSKYTLYDTASLIKNGKEGLSVTWEVNNIVAVRDSAYSSSDAATFKTAMNGVYLFYELETPLHYTDCMYSEDGGQTFIPLDRAINYEWYGISNNTEVKADTLPWYRSGQNTDTLVVDAMYGEDIRVVLRAKDEVGNLIPPKAYRSIHWRIPDTDTNVKSDNGGTVRSDTKQMTFDTIVNVKGAVLSEEKKKANLRFNWVTRYDNSSYEVDKGWGQKKTIQAQDLVNVHGKATTLVFPYVYLLGAYEQVTEDGIVVTENGETVYDRPL